MKTSTAPDAKWSRLEALVKQLSGSARTREPARLREFWTLYRSATSRLAVLRSAGRKDDEEYYLNRLVASAHAVLYRRRASDGSARSLARFLGSGWPELVRAHGRLVAIASAVFVLGALCGAFYSAEDPGFLALVAPPDILSSIEAGEMWTSGLLAVRPAASSAIFSNNFSVAMLAFAFGMTAGLGTMWILFLNGASLGALTVAVVERGMAGAFFGFVVPHGVLEIPAVLIAGAAGLALGQGMLFPGEHTRRRALALAARGAVRLLFGCGPVLLVAAAIEAYFSPLDLELGVKLGVGAILALAFAGYVARGGSGARAGRRPRRPAPGATERNHRGRPPRPAGTPPRR